MHVTRTSIQGPIDREPQCHVFYDQHAAWIEVGDKLPRYSSDEPGLKKYKSVRKQEF